MLELQLKTSWNYKGQRGSETFFHTAIGNFMTAMRDWAPAFRVMAEEVLQPSVMRQFDSEGHGTWAQLAPSTIARKGHSIILFETGELKGSFRRGGTGHVEDIDRQSMRWGTRIPHALFHQTGTGASFQSSVRRPGRGLPMRKMIDLSGAEKRTMRSIMVQRLATIARREGFGISKGLSLDPLGARRVGQSLLGFE